MTLAEDDDLPVLVTSAEAAVLAGVEPPTVRAWKSRGKLRPVARGGHGENLYPLADVFAIQRGIDPRTHREPAKT